MAKKKQKRGSDKRGYSQGPAATNNAPTSATAAAPASAKQSSSQSSPSKQQAQGQQLLPTLSTLKFQNKLATITTTLQSLTFSPNQIEKVVLALQYDITLEKSLDWLCLNYYNLEGDDNLPCLFVDGSVRLLFQNDDNDSCEEEEGRMKLSVVKTVHRAVEQDDDDDDCYGRKENNILNVDGTNDGHVDDERIKKKQEMDQMKKQQEEEEQRVKEEEEEEEERKNWLLQRYEYEEDDDDYGDDKNKNAITNNSEQEQQQQEEEEEQSPEETLLHQQETKLHLLEADLNNDANNYMRSKFEMKQLQNEVKKMRQMVNGLRRKVERGKKAEESRRREEEVEMQQQQQQVEEEEEEGNGPMFDLFGNSNDDDEEGEGCDDNEVTPNQAASSTPTTSAITPTTPTKQLDYTIPISWTGTTPQKKLDEVLKKQQLPHAKYTKLPMNAGFKLTITTLLDTDSDKNTTNSTKKKKKKQQPQTIVKQYEANHRDYTKTSSLKDHLATLALYELDPSLPLYSVFPGPFRELWLSWMNEVREKREMEQKEVEGEKKAYIDHLIGLIEKVRIEQRGEGGGGEKGDVLSEKVDTITKVDDDGSGEVVDDWEDEEVEDDVAVRITASKDPSTTGMRLQKEFTKRMSTPSYQTMKAVRDTLPMLQYRQNILDTVKDHPVVIVQADTGAGKSTQCGQYILEQALIDGMGDAVNMICTQPRRVAATSVAERVADEMVESLGNMVGYQIRMESRRSSRTKLLFCTTGVVLRRLQDDPNLTGVTHVIVDEVHERQQQTDVLLIVLRQLLQTTRPDLKVILMSATMDEKLFCSFFHGAPLVSVPGRTFPVNNYYLEDLLEATNHLIEESSRYALRDTYRGEKTQMMITTRGGEKRKQMVDCHDNPLSMELDESFYPGFKLSTRLSLWRVNEEAINYDLVEDVLMLLLVKQDYSALAPPDGADMSSKGSILIFLPGLGEIKALAERLGGNRHFRSCDVIPMHSTLSSKDQRRAFTPALSRRTKIILGTNICETSITLPDVVCVIDCGRVRQVTRNKRTGGSMLIQQWCAKSSCKQRAGRAGRVQPGMCLKLYSSNTAEYIMKAESEPELRRVPLEEVCMSILASGFSQNCMQFLSQAPQPPSIDSVRAAVEVLHQVGAVEAGNEIERLTPLGLHLAKLPVDVRIAKMMIFGVLFCSIDPVLTIAASLSSKSPFAEFFNDDGTAKAKQKQFMDPDSDFITYVNVWEAYSKAAEISPSAARKFCKENYLNFVALREIGDSRRQFLDLLCSIGFLDKSDAAKLKQSAFNRHARKHELVHAVCAAGFYPNIARLDQSPAMDISLWHNNERIYFHGKSVNASKKRFQSSDKWIVFHEKFGTTHRTSVATTAFVHPFVLCLFGSSVVVKHTERKVLVDGWMELRMAAQVGVFLREVRNQLDLLLQEVFEHSDKKRIEKMDNDVIEGIVGILSAECA